MYKHKSISKWFLSDAAVCCNRKLREMHCANGQNLLVSLSHAQWGYIRRPFFFFLFVCVPVYVLWALSAVSARVCIWMQAIFLIFFTSKTKTAAVNETLLWYSTGLYYTPWFTIPLKGIGSKILTLIKSKINKYISNMKYLNWRLK